MSAKNTLGVFSDDLRRIAEMEKAHTPAATGTDAPAPTPTTITGHTPLHTPSKDDANTAVYTQPDKSPDEPELAPAPIPSSVPEQAGTPAPPLPQLDTPICEPLLKRTQHYLSAEQIAYLDKLAKRTGVTRSDWMRYAVDWLRVSVEAGAVKVPKR